MIYFLLLFLLLMVFYTYKIFRYQSIWENIPNAEPCTKHVAQTKISVLIAARNEEKNLPHLLESILTQNYPKDLFEVIVINDHSTDGTEDILKTFCALHSHFRYYNLQNHLDSNQTSLAYKKLALTLGISKCENELIVCTDADSVVPATWLSMYNQVYQDKGWQFMAAPVRLKSPSSILGIFQSLDFLTLQGITGAAVYKKLHAMCNGANLAFTKKAFIEVDGYKGIDHIPSGDDFLLMDKIIRKYPQSYGYIKSEAVIVETEAPQDWQSFIQQRIRWASKSGHYTDKSISSTLILVFLINLCFLILGISSLFGMKWFIFFCLLVFAKILIEYPFVENIAKFFSLQRYMKYFPILQIPHILYTVMVGFLGKLKKYEWKGREIPTK